MTPSSKSEPELETQPATPGPTETIDLTSTDTPKDAPSDAEIAADSPPPTIDAEALAEALESVEDKDEDRTDEDRTDAEDVDHGEILEAEPSDRYPTLIPLIGSLLGLTAIAALMLIAFALPAVKSAPNRLPIGVAGSTEFQTQVKDILSQDGLKPFSITSYAGEAELRSAITDREVYGGLSLNDASGVAMLVSSAASPVAASTLGSLAGSLASDGQIPVTDVVKLPEADPRGEGLAAANLPLVIAAVLPALLLIPLYRRRTAARLAVIVGAAVVIGLGLSAILDYALGSTDGSNFLLVSVGLMAGVLATSLLLNGLFAAAGRVGIGVGAALLVLFAAPLSGLSTAPEWLPSPWGDVGQLLPAGANATLLRSTAYFDGQGGGSAALVLAVWALIGLLLLGLGSLINRRKAAQPELAPEPLTVTL